VSGPGEDGPVTQFTNTKAFSFTGMQEKSQQQLSNAGEKDDLE
jgi:hypothetical protein